MEQDEIWAPLIGLIYSAVPFVLTLVLFALLSPTSKVVGEGFTYAPGLLTKPVGMLLRCPAESTGLTRSPPRRWLAFCVWLF